MKPSRNCTTDEVLPWAHLPNAHHIDWALASSKAHPDQWAAALDAALDATSDAASDAAWGAARDAARGAALDAAWGAARDAAWDAARGAARGAAQDAAWYAARGAALDAARSAVFALVAWDDCDYLFALPEHAVRWLASEGDHAAVMLLPMCIVKQRNLLSGE